jgi:membrane protease subunit HflK
VFDDKNYKSPWGKPANSSNEETIEARLKKSANKLRDLFNGKNNFFNSPNKALFSIIGGIILLFWLLSGFYIVNEGEQAAVTRFGKFARIATPGPNYHLPAPFEQVQVVNVEHSQKEEIGFRSVPTNSKAANYVKITGNDKLALIPQESLMLTGDENIVDINFSVQWHISNLKDYLYNVVSVKDTVKSAAESAMREVIGNTPIAAAQTEGRAKIEEEAKILLQKILDKYQSGIIIENLHLLKVDPPTEVIDAFRDVQTARADKERLINQAEAYSNDILPKARGEAAKMIQDAEGYKSNVIEKARGEANRFSDIYKQYANAKEVTKKRMYLEAMEDILQDATKFIIGDEAGKSVVPYLLLNKDNKVSSSTENEG